MYLYTDTDEYKLTPQMRPKLLLGRLDPGV